MLQSFVSLRLRAALVTLAGLAVGLGALAAPAESAAPPPLNLAGIQLDRAAPTMWQVASGAPVSGVVDYTVVNVLATQGINTIVVVGLRDMVTFQWVGGEPQMVGFPIMIPPVTSVSFLNQAFTLTAPVAAGNYQVWLYASSTAANLAAARAEFKAVDPRGYPGSNVRVGNVSAGQITGDRASITVLLSSVTGMPWLAGDDINGTFAFTMWRGDSIIQNCIVTVGLRDMTGNWVGPNDPVVVQNVVPPHGQPGQMYTNNKITNLATPPGVISFVWVHLSEGQTDPIAAVQDFKATVATMETLTDKIVGVVIGPANGLIILQQTPPQWSLKAPGGKPATISGSMTVQMQLPAGVFVTQQYMVVVGIRDESTGAWVGGEPQIIAMDSPPWDLPHVFMKRGFAGLSLPASGNGPFGVWARMIQTTSTAVAIRDFKTSIVLAENDRNRRVGAILVPVPGILVTNQRPTAWLCPRQVQPWVTGSATIQMWNGRDQTLAQKVVVGIRNIVTGAWVGGEPQVILTDTPPSDLPGKTYSARQWYKISTLKLAPGTYALWVRRVQTTSDAAAIKAFKVTFPVPDPQRDASVGVVTVP